MDSVVAVIVVCGLLNVIPWLLLAYFRPDLKINDQVQTIDEGLAMVAKALFERFENLEELAEGFRSIPAENPLQQLLVSFMQSRLEGNEVYGRNDDGTFNGARTFKEIKPSEEVEEP
jgi:ABC-type phosphate transport system auxiliary subunit